MKARMPMSTVRPPLTIAGDGAEDGALCLEGFFERVKSFGRRPALACELIVAVEVAAFDGDAELVSGLHGLLILGEGGERKDRLRSCSRCRGETESSDTATTVASICLEPPLRSTAWALERGRFRAGVVAKSSIVVEIGRGRSEEGRCRVIAHPFILGLRSKAVRRGRGGMPRDDGEDLREVGDADASSACQRLTVSTFFLRMEDMGFFVCVSFSALRLRLILQRFAVRSSARGTAPSDDESCPRAGCLRERLLQVFSVENIRATG